jgi:hypothetical protein
LASYPRTGINHVVPEKSRYRQVRLKFPLTPFPGNYKTALVRGCRLFGQVTTSAFLRTNLASALIQIRPASTERHIRTVPVPNWVKETLDVWLTVAGIESGPLFRCVCRAGKLWGHGISDKTVWHVVKKTLGNLH